jgi:hypothetical protein
MGAHQLGRAAAEFTTAGELAASLCCAVPCKLLQIEQCRALQRASWRFSAGEHGHELCSIGV